MVETISIGGLYKQNNELFEFCIMGHVVVGHCAWQGACEEFGLTQQGEPMSEQALKWAQWLVLGPLHNLMVVMICTMGMWILNNDI
jgi:hypothetical protein